MARESRQPKAVRTTPEPSHAVQGSKARKSRRGAARAAYGTRGAVRDKETVPFGAYRASIYRRADVGSSSYFMRLYLKDEGRYYRKSLGTKDRREARERATTELVQLLAKLQTGQRILAISLADLKRRFAIEQGKRVSDGRLAANTQRAHHYRIENGIKFLREKLQKDNILDTRLSAIDGSVFRDYLAWRLEGAAAANRTVRRDVVRDELLTIRQMFLYAKKERWCTDKTVPNWDFTVEKEPPSRERMTQRNYTDVINVLRSWAAEAKSEKDVYNRRMLQHFILLISNTGMRSGEAFGLKNRDIEMHRTRQECVITIRPETSKVRRGRKIVLLASVGGRVENTKPINYLIRWIDQYQRHKKPSDFVFATYANKGRKNPASGSVLHPTAGDVIYKGYGALRKKLADLQLDWFDPYHCRHFYITNRLLAEEPIHIVAKVCGTSVKEIEATYSHVLTEIASRNFGKKRVVYDKEGGYGVHDKDASQTEPDKNDPNGGTASNA